MVRISVKSGRARRAGQRTCRATASRTPGPSPLGATPTPMRVSGTPNSRANACSSIGARRRDDELVLLAALRGVARRHAGRRRGIASSSMHDIDAARGREVTRRRRRVRRRCRSRPSRRARRARAPRECARTGARTARDARQSARVRCSHAVERAPRAAERAGHVERVARARGVAPSGCDA